MAPRALPSKCDQGCTGMEVGWEREQRLGQHWESCRHPRETGSRAGDGQGVWLGGRGSGGGGRRRGAEVTVRGSLRGLFMAGDFLEDLSKTLSTL